MRSRKGQRRGRRERITFNRALRVKRVWRGGDDYLDRDSAPLADVLEWSRRFEDPQYRSVKLTWFGPREGEARCFLSTVWHGLDLSHGLARAPEIFQTVLFIGGAYADGARRIFDNQEWRATYEREALAVHRAVARWFGPVFGALERQRTGTLTDERLDRWLAEITAAV